MLKKDKMTNDNLKDIQILKKLFILHMMKSGATSREIRKVLKMNGTNFRKMIPIKNIKTYKKE